MTPQAQERIKADAKKPGLTDRIIREAKQFAFYNYCSAAHNADFDNLETWPYAAQVAYYAISNYMSGNPISWPYSTKTIPMDLKDVAFEAALQQWKGTGKEVENPCPHCGKELHRDRNLCCRECGKEVGE